MPSEDYVGKYVDISFKDSNEGASGWVAEVQKVDGIETLVFDYGYGYPITSKTIVKVVDPPPGDKGMYIPDESELGCPPGCTSPFCSCPGTD